MHMYMYMYIRIHARWELRLQATKDAAVAFSVYIDDKARDPLYFWYRNP